MQEDATNNVFTEEVAPQMEDAPSEQVETTEEVSESPAPEADKEELIGGKFKSTEDLLKSYQEMERERTRDRQMLSNPQFIYDQARRLGLTDEQATQAANNAQPIAPASPIQLMDVPTQVNFQLKVEKSKEMYPELESNTRYQKLVTALMMDPESDTYLDPVASAKEFFSDIRKAEKQAEGTGAIRAKQEITEKEKASTVTATSKTSSDAEEQADLLRRSKSKNPKVQQEAMVELLMRRNRQ